MVVGSPNGRRREEAHVEGLGGGMGGSNGRSGSFIATVGRTPCTQSKNGGCWSLNRGRRHWSGFGRAASRGGDCGDDRLGLAMLAWGDLRSSLLFIWVQRRCANGGSPEYSRSRRHCCVHSGTDEDSREREGAGDAIKREGKDGGAIPLLTRATGRF